MNATTLPIAAASALLMICPASAQGPTANPSVHQIRLEVFARSDSEICAEAIRYASDLADRERGLTLVVHDVLEDRAQLSRLWKLARQWGREKPVVPAFHCCDQIFFGFASKRESGRAIEDLFTADVYTRSTCKRCKSAKAFIGQLGSRWPALRFRIYEITGDANARQRYENLCRSRGQLPALPTLHFAGQVIIGYQGDEITGAQYEDLIRRVAGEPATVKSDAREARIDRSTFGGVAAFHLIGFFESQLDQSHPSEAEYDDVPLPDDLALPEEAGPTDIGQVAPASAKQQNAQPLDIIDVPLFGPLRASEMGLPLFTFLVGLVDGFNPCAMWILVFLLSVLVNIKDRRKILLIAGTFVVVSGVAYFAFMAAWLNLFLLIGFARPAQIILGLMATVIGLINVKDFFAFKKGVTLSIPESSKPGLYRRVREIVSAQYLSAALFGVVVLAVIVNMVELLCTAGLPALYTQILTMQELPTWKNYGYLALYISAYMLDDAVLLSIVVVTLSHRKLQEREGRWLKLISGLVILALGIVMIVKPSWLQLGST